MNLQYDSNVRVGFIYIRVHALLIRANYLLFYQVKYLYLFCLPTNLYMIVQIWHFLPTFNFCKYFLVTKFLLIYVLVVEVLVINYNCIGILVIWRTTFVTVRMCTSVTGKTCHKCVWSSHEKHICNSWVLECHCSIR